MNIRGSASSRTGLLYRTGNGDSRQPARLGQRVVAPNMGSVAQKKKGSQALFSKYPIWCYSASPIQVLGASRMMCDSIPVKVRSPKKLSGGGGVSLNPILQAKAKIFRNIYITLLENQIGEDKDGETLPYLRLPSHDRNKRLEVSLNKVYSVCSFVGHGLCRKPTKAMVFVFNICVHCYKGTSQPKHLLF